MKYLIIILFLFVSVAAFPQSNPPIVPRSSQAITVEDARWKAQLNMYGVRTHGLTLNGGLDSLAALLYEDSSQHWWFRDTLKVAPFGHIWSEFLKSGDATNILLQNQGANLGVINTLNAQNGLVAGFSGGVGTLNVIPDTIYTLLPLFTRNKDTIGMYNVDTVGGVTGNDGYLSAVQYTYLYHKQQPIQFQSQGVNIGSPGQFPNVNFGTNMTVTQFGNQITINALAPPAFQKSLTWLNDSSAFAGSGVIDSVVLSTGLIGAISHGTLSIKVKPDTIFNRNLLSTAGTDTSDAGGNAFFNTHFNMRGIYSFSFDSLQGGLFMNGLANKSTLLSTDSVLINDVSGQVWKVPASAIGGGGGTQTLQQVFNTEIGGSILTKTDTILENSNHSLRIIDSSSANTALQIQVLNSVSSSGLSVTNNSSSNANLVNIANAGTQAGIIISGTNASASAPGLSSTIIATSVSAISGTGVFQGVIGNYSGSATGNNNAALYGNSTNSNAAPGLIARGQNTASSLDVISEIRRTNSSSPVSGIGAEQDWYISSVSNPDPGLVAVKEKAISTNTTDATFTGEYHIGLNNLGSFPATDQFILSGNGEARFSGIPALGLSTDTTNNKPVGMDANGNLIKMTNWYGGSGGGGGNSVGRDSVVAITSGTSSTVTSGYNIVQINPASLISTYTLTLPATWHTSNDVIIVFGGTITSGNPVITSFSVVNGSGQTLVQAVAPSGTFNAGEAIRYHLVGTNDYRIN